MIKLDLWDIVNAKISPERTIKETLVMDRTLAGDAAVKWAEDAASKIIAEFAKSVAIDTAHYQLCGFMLAAAAVAQRDPEFARQIGELMEPPRSFEADKHDFAREPSTSAASTKK